MLSAVKAFVRRYPRLLSAYRALQWRQHLFADWLDNVLGEKLRSAVTPYGFQLVVRNNPANRAMLQGTFEPEETAILLQHLPRVDVFVDIGANIGFYTCLALKYGKHVIAVEPQSRNLQCLFASLEVNNWTDQIEVFPVGLGPRPTVSILYGASGPSASLVRNWAQYNPKYKQMIPISTLDIVLADRFVGRGVFIKIDVEGYEHQVLQGALTIIKQKPRPIWLIEIFFDEHHPPGINPSFRDTFELFWRHGYEARTANAQNSLVRPTDVDRWCRIKQCDSGTTNYIFTEPIKANAG